MPIFNEQEIEAIVKKHLFSRHYTVYQEFAVNACYAVEKKLNMESKELDDIVFTVAHRLWSESGRPWL